MRGQGPARYRTIFFAGASFMLLPDLEDAARTLRRIRDHLEPGGQAIILLYVPPRSAEAKHATDQWRARESVRPSDGATLRVHEKFHYDSRRQLRVATLRYEVSKDGVIVQTVERPWLLRWYSREEFRTLLQGAGLETKRRPRPHRAHRNRRHPRCMAPGRSLGDAGRRDPL